MLEFRLIFASNNYETSLFSLHSTGQDSGVEFLSSRELYETSPDSFQRGATNGELLCPRHAKAHLELRQQPHTDSRWVAILAASAAN